VRRLLTHNLALKLLSLLAAAGVWLWVSGEERLEFSFPAPLVLQNLPSPVALAADPPDEVMVRLRAPEVLLKSLSAGDIDARIDLAGLAAGEHAIPITAEQVRVPYGAEVVKVVPEVVTLRLEPRVVREVAVEPRVEGTVEEGFRVAEVSVEPDRVAVEGPEGAVNAVDRLGTARVPLEGRREPFTASVGVLVGNPLLRLVEERPVTVRVRLERVR
jgi:YbbR domain-containing protein